MCHISVTASSGQHRLPRQRGQHGARTSHTGDPRTEYTATSQPLHLTSEDHTELEISEITSQILSSQLEVGC